MEYKVIKTQEKKSKKLEGNIPVESTRYVAELEGAGQIKAKLESVEPFDFEVGAVLSLKSVGRQGRVVEE